MKPSKITIKNFKNIKDLTTEIPDDATIMICRGDNAVGKTSVLQAFEVALGETSHLSVKPLRDGQEKGLIELTAKDSDGKEFIFRTKFKNEGKTTFEVETEDGMKDSRKGVIANMVGDISFDIFKFVEMSATTKGQKEQVEIVRSFLDKETLDELKKIEDRILLAYNQRTDNNRDIKTLEGFIAESGLNPEDFKKYGEEKNVEALLKKRTVAREQQTKRQQNISNINSSLETMKERQPAIDKDIKILEKKIEDLRKEKEVNAENIDKGKQWLVKNPVIDIFDIEKEYDDALAHNLKASQVATHKKKKADLDSARAITEDLTIRYESSKQSLEDAIRDMSMPIKGLSFDNDKLIYKGNPVDINTLSTSEIMHIGIQLKIAKNPNVKILTLDRGESLGTDKLKQIQDLAKKFSYFIVMEQVERQKKGKEKLIIEILAQ